MEFFSPGHLAVLAVVAAFLFFGWKQLPDMARSLGRSMRVFKTEIKGMSGDDKARDGTDDVTNAVEAPVAIDAPKVVRIQAEPRQPIAAAHSERPRPTPRPTAQTTPGRPGPTG